MSTKQDHINKMLEKRDKTVEKYDFYMIGTGLFTDFEKAKAIIAKSKEKVKIENTEGKPTHLKHDKTVDFDSQILDTLLEGTPQ